MGGAWTLPSSVRSTIEANKVGYVSVHMPSGAISTNPVSYYFEDGYVFFMTPRASRRYKFMREKPDVTFTVDNGELLEKCAGIMIQGRVECFSPSRLVLSLKSVFPKLLKYIKKYPEGIPFYALGTLGLKKLPDERKIHNYDFIRLNPVKVFYWYGYNFGRIGAKSGEMVSDDPVLLARQVLMGDLSVADEESPGFDVLDIMNLSAPMRRTALALAMFGAATPERVAGATKQSISAEKANLDALVRMGYATKTEGRREYFMED